MKFPAFLLLTLAACATAPQPIPTPPRPVREVHRMVEGRLPHFALREMALGATLDSIVRGSSPSASGQVLCSTGVGVATFQTPAACGISGGSGPWTVSTRELDGAGGQLKLTDTTDENRFMGWIGFPATATNVLRYQFADAFNGLQLGSGDRLQMFSFHGIEVRGARGASTTPAAVTGGGTADPSMRIYSGGAGGALTLDATAGGNALTVTAGLASTQAITAAGLITASAGLTSTAGSTTLGTTTVTGLTATAGTNSFTGTVATSSLNIGAGGAITFDGATTKAVSAVSCAASTCTSLGTATITGAAVTGICVVGHTTTAGAIGTNGTALNLTCGVTAANTVTLYCCNQSTGALALTGTYALRVVQ